ncbi:MAG: hypothetical protein BMS9Abin34_090 [Patescibacteria group bacterium]|nr:MAG: hypothetical protein BMS9Abin34_090 [Patescibacteria group bacterium]
MSSLYVIFKRELRDFVFAERFFSKRFLLYLALIFLPVVLMAVVVNIFNTPSGLERISALYPEPIIALTAAFAMMFYICAAAGLSFTLVAIIHSGNFVAGEQTSGTLSLLVSKPIRRWKIIIGKYLAFLAILIPLILLAVGSMALLVYAMGIGAVSGKVFLGFLVTAVGIGAVYTSIGTLFSSMTKNSLMAILGAFIFMLGWFMFDFIIVYLPENIANVIKHGLVGYHTNTISAYISGGEATLKMMHAPGEGLTAFFGSLIFILLLVIVPVVASVVVLQKRDIHG